MVDGRAVAVDVDLFRKSLGASMAGNGIVVFGAEA